METNAAPVQFRRLGATDATDALTLFRVMAAVFDEHAGELDVAYVERTLASNQFWAVAASLGGEIIGGITAHALPMTNRPSHELFIYDLAVNSKWQRRGVGSGLIACLRNLAEAEGIDVTFVAADVEDGDAVAFYRAIGGEEESVAMFTFDGSGAD